MPVWFQRLNAVVTSPLFVPVRIIILVLVAILVRRLLCRLVDRTMNRTLSSEPHSRLTDRIGSSAIAAPERRIQRIKALASLAKSMITAVIGLVLVVEVFSELGFNVTTIVASTTVIGLTVGFGMQNIIKDLLSGVLMLVDDQLGVGDFVEMAESSGGASGVVEAVGFRVTQLRDDDGTVWYVRNGEVLRVGNYSQGGAGRPVEKREFKPIAVRPAGRRLLRSR